MTRRRALRSVTLLAVALASLALPAGAQQRPERPRATQSGAPPHGTPKGWEFTLPKGDPARGRAAFVKFECAKCHEVKGERFAAPTDKESIGPELAMMGPLHDADYFAEAIVNPGAVIEKGKGYAAPDGSSKMPSYNDSMTVQEMIDLVAYLKSLKPPAGTRGGHGH